MESKRTIFEVGGKPFIAIAGEVHNSSSSNAEYMLGVWEKAQEQGLNTLLLPVSWELVEPVEGQFDFKLVETIILQARERNMHLILLWFGSWKNAACMYAPEWVKTDTKRFPRAQVEVGKNKTFLASLYGTPYTTLSYLGENTWKADAKAFAKFMEHLKSFDEKEQTVLGVQVENETGLLGSAREHSKEADAVFASKVPGEFVSYMRGHTGTMDPEIREAIESGAAEGNWKEVFGVAAEELFSAYHVASFVEKVASAGKKAYDLPMSVNCWLDKGDEPGNYPTGGPTAKVMEVWKYATPSIDVFCPDIYVHNFLEVCDNYTKLDNPLFIPETAIHSHCAPRLVYCIGHYHAACFAPFGFEEMGEPFGNSMGALFGVDVNDPLLSTPQKVSEYRFCCDAISNMMDLITQRYGTDDLQAAMAENTEEGADTMLFGEFGFQIITEHPYMSRKDGVCLVLRADENTFYLLGNGCIINYFSTNERKPNCDIISLEEGLFENGKWINGRRLNGDESAVISFEKFGLLKLKVFNYE